MGKISELFKILLQLCECKHGDTGMSLKSHKKAYLKLDYNS